MYDTILVPVDASELSQRAVHAALGLADRFGSRVTLLHIRPKAASLEHGRAEADLDAIDAQSDRLLQIGLRELRQGHSVTPEQVRSEVRAGPVVGTIVEAATDGMVDLIVMGTHGRHRVSELFTGSTAEQVVSKTSASVLVVKPEGFPFLRT
jgi:nucleotide-binding universal stress UspA family protein